MTDDDNDNTPAEDAPAEASAATDLFGSSRSGGAETAATTDSVSAPRRKAKRAQAAPEARQPDQSAGPTVDPQRLPPPVPLRLTGPSSSQVPPNQEFFIPIHAFVRLGTREVAVVNHPAFQRLGEINQLGQAFLVYRGATHRRHEHSLGTLHVVQMMMDALARNADAEASDDSFAGVWRRDERLRPAEAAFVRLGALLHDIGHLPAGHTLEDELGLFVKHDSVERIEFICDRPQWLETTYEPLGALVDRLYADVMPDTGYSVAPRELLLALVASDYSAVRQDRKLQDTEQFRLGVCRDLIGNTICGDLLDYLHRDWHHLGKHKQFDTRLIDYMEIRRDATAGDSRLVVFLRGGDKVRNDGVSAILDLLESRYQLYEMALFHRTKLAATSMLERAVGELAEALGDEWIDRLPDQLLDWSDAEMLANLRTQALAAAPNGRDSRAPALAAVAHQFVRVRHRVLHKKLYQLFRDQLTAPDADRIESLYAYAPGRDENRRDAGLRRLTALRHLEADFGLPPLTLTMYCPPRSMGTKVAQVQILLNGDVRRLEEHEARDRRLTGKHLEAQKERFRNLWHVYFACERTQLEELRSKQLYPVLIDAINCFVLRRDQGPISLEERALSLAHTVASTPETPWHGREVVDDLAVANRQAEVSFYPGQGAGLPALRFLYKT